MTKGSLIPRIIYFTSLTFLVCLAVFLPLTARKTSQVDRALSNAVSFDAAWVQADGTRVDNPAKLNLLPGASVTEENSIYARLPEQIPEGSSLCFRAKHLLFSIFIDGENVYTQDLPESRFYTNSNGVTWTFVPLSAQDSGKTVELRFRVCYPNSVCGIDYLQIASERGMALKVIEEKLFGFIMAIIYLTVTIVLMILDVSITGKLNYNHDFLYLGLCTFGVALYCIVETQLFQLFIGDGRIIHLLSCSSLLLLPLPVVLYTNALFGFQNKYIVPVFSAVYAVVFTALAVLNFTDIADYHDMLGVTNTMILASVVIMFGSIICYIYRTFREKRRVDIYLFFEIIGLVVLLTSGLIDMSRFYFTNTNDPAKCMRIGLLVFIVLYAVTSSQKLVTALKLSTRAELMAKLAYQDGLTGLYNRTAYNKKLEELSSSKDQVGICAFDVNNLKQVNDNLGHEAGDELLKESALLISRAFESGEGICYRTGGDEFIVLIPGDKAEERITSSMELLKWFCTEVNEQKGHPFRISIAGGSCVYDGTESLDVVINAADKSMYENKQKMKAAETAF